MTSCPTRPTASSSAPASPRAASTQSTPPPPAARPGVIAIVTTLDMPRLKKARINAASLFGGPDIEHYHQAVAVVVAETFEQARDAASMIRVDYARQPGRFDLAAEAPNAKLTNGDSGEGSGSPGEERAGHFEEAFAAAPVKLDATYTTPDESHSMMEPTRQHRRMAGRKAHRLDLQPDDRLGQARPRRNARHLRRQRPPGLALCRRRLRRQALPARRRRARRPRRQGRADARSSSP